MILADIGNTNYHIWENGKISHSGKAEKFNEIPYYISVSKKKEKEFLKLNPGAVNLAEYVFFNTKYKNLGIDRIMACKSINSGIVVDAGSAVTVDIMQNGFHKGGIIMPGIYAFKEAFGKISEVLDFNPGKIKKELPNSTQEALNCGSIGAIKCMIEKFSVYGDIYTTGGDGKLIAGLFSNAYYNEDLIFKGMIKTIEEMERK